MKKFLSLFVAVFYSAIIGATVGFITWTFLTLVYS